MKIAIHTQHFLGVGHFVRMKRLAARLALKNTVYLYVGGPPPFAGWKEKTVFKTIQLPILRRYPTGGIGSECGCDLSVVLKERSKVIRDQLRQLVPDVLITEFFPFSRWTLREEYFETIQAVKEFCPNANIICSLRDVPRAPSEGKPTVDTSWDPKLGRPVPVDPRDDFLSQSALSTLNSHYSSLLVHSDPRVTRLNEHFPWTERIQVPVHYTGYIAETFEPSFPKDVQSLARPLAVVSVGAGAGGLNLLRVAAEAWRYRSSRKRGGVMVIFAGAYNDASQIADLKAKFECSDIVIKPFSSTFKSWLAHADISISRAGYNTCIDVLSTLSRSILVPTAVVSDQVFRAKKFNDLGLAEVLHQDELNPVSLARLIDKVLAAPVPQNDINLAGVENTIKLLSWLS